VPQERVEEIFGLPVGFPPDDQVFLFGQDVQCDYVYEDAEASRTFSFSVWPSEEYSLEEGFGAEAWAALERVDIGDGGVIDSETNTTLEWMQDGRVFQILVLGFGEVEGTPDAAERKELILALARDISAAA